MTADMLIEEESRLGALHRHGLPGGIPDDVLERIIAIAQAGTGAPIAAVTLVERNRQSYLAVSGMPDTPLPRHESFCAETILDHGPMIVADAKSDHRFAASSLVTGDIAARAYLGVPLISSDGYPLGAICVMDTQARTFSASEVAILENLAQLAMHHLAMRQPDSFDMLTGALTRRRFQAEVEREFDRARRYDRPAALLFLDIDRFRSVNEVLGQGMADEVLKAIVNRCMETLRSTDLFGRIGGEEFAILLPETLAYEASQCAERMREIVSKLRFRSTKGTVSVTASFGVVPLSSQIRSAVQWFAQADVALYAAKQSGRDCVSFAPPIDSDGIDLRDKRIGDLTVPRLH